MAIRGAEAHQTLGLPGPLNHPALSAPDLAVRLPLLFVDLLTLHVSDAACTQAGAVAGSLKSLFVVIMAQRPRAILLAGAMVTSMRGFLASIRPSQLPSGAPLRLACCTTAIAPVMSRRRMSRWPIFDVAPSRCLPPVECCRGTRPSHAAKSRDRRKMVMGGAKVSIAIAVIGPTPGMVCSLRVLSASVGGGIHAIRLRKET